MMLKCAAAAALGLALLASTAASQTAAELMQKAIYAQQTAGDLDTAIQLYRQILTSSGADRKTAAAVQFRLAQSLLQKGELAEAAREFQTLANYPEYKDVVAQMAAKLPASTTGPIIFSNGASGSVIRHGTYTTESGRGGTYVHRATGVQLTIPPGWTLLDTEPDHVTVLVGGTGGSIRVFFNIESNLATTLAGQFKSTGDPIFRSTGTNSFASLGCPASSDGHVPARGWARSATKNVLFIGESSLADCQAFQKGFVQLLSSTVVP